MTSTTFLIRALLVTHTYHVTFPLSPSPPPPPPPPSLPLLPLSPSPSFYFSLYSFLLSLSLSLDEGGANVLVKRMIIAPKGRDEISLDLTGMRFKFSLT